MRPAKPEPPDRVRHALRPLPLHLSHVLNATQGSLAALLNPGLSPWHPAVAEEAESLQARIGDAGRIAVANALAEQIVGELDAFRAGLRRYCRHPWRHRPSEHVVLAQQGSVTLRRYPGEGAPVILIPSLINGSEVLDLLPDRSLVRSLQRAGLAVHAIDWGTPGHEEARLSVDGYVTERVLPLIDAAAAQAGRPVALVGYCMGGLVALAAACLRPGAIAALALLAMPWDFDHAGPLKQLAAGMVLDGSDPVPADRVQSLFVSLDPTLTLRKFIRFAGLPDGDPETTRFVAVESWANGGPPLAAPAARQVVQDWYGANRPGRRLWGIAGTPIVPPAPSGQGPDLLFALTDQDRIVPRACALPAVCADARRLDPKAGHVGMMVGSQAERSLHRPLAEWLLERTA